MVEGGVKKRLVGTVVSNRMDKTAAVLVERLTRHRKYSKYVKRRAKYLAHDPQNACRIGDKVRIIESRPISRMKRWQVLDVIQRGSSES
jgi:small subunit ribosomal protein S17